MAILKDLLVNGTSRFIGKIYGTISNADLATKATGDGDGNTISSTYAKSVALTGDVTGSATVSSGAASVTTTLANSGATAGSYGPSANASPAHGGTFSVPYVTVDAKGRVTAASTKTITLPASGNTDKYVLQGKSTTSNWRNVLLGYNDTSVYNTDITSVTNQVYETKGFSFQPSTGTLKATTFSGNLTGNVTGNCSGSSGSCTGNAATATKATQDGDGNTISSTYLKLSGGTMTGPIKWNSTSLTQDTTGTYVCTIDAFASGGQQHWASANILSVAQAAKLGSTTVGGTTTPIYLNAGTATACSYTILTSVPSGAVFTDTKNTAGSTDTSSKIFLIGATSQAANPQTYSQDTAYVGTDGCLYSGGSKVLTGNQTVTLSGDASGSGTTAITVTLANSGATAGSYGPSANASPAHSGTFSVPYITVDAKGRVTAASTKTITLPASGNTDAKVTQTVTDSSTTTYPILFTTTANATATATTTTRFCTAIKAAPNGTLTATTFSGALSGNATSATKATQDGSGNTITSTYLKLSGGTMTGTLTGTVVKTTSYVQATTTALSMASGHPTGAAGEARLYKNGLSIRGAGNDSCEIFFDESTTNAGYMVIGTGDDGTEPIYVRQYNTSNAVAHQITLMDASGNQSLNKVALGTSGSVASGDGYAVTGGTVYSALGTYAKLPKAISITDTSTNTSGTGYSITIESSTVTIGGIAYYKATIALSEARSEYFIYLNPNNHYYISSITTTSGVTLPDGTHLSIYGSYLVGFIGYGNGASLSYSSLFSSTGGELMETNISYAYFQNRSRRYEEFTYWSGSWYGKTYIHNTLYQSSSVVTSENGYAAPYSASAVNTLLQGYVSTSGKAASATSADSATKATQDGSGNVITSTYLPLAGGTMTGTITTPSSGDWLNWRANSNLQCSATANSNEWSIDLKPGDYTGTYWQVWTNKNSKSTLLKVDTDSGVVSAPYGFSGALTGNVTGNCSGSSGSCTGNAATASKLGTSTVGGTSSPIYLNSGVATECDMRNNLVGSVQSDTASLSSYWCKIASRTNTSNYNDHTFTFILTDGYATRQTGIFNLHTRREGSNTSGGLTFNRLCGDFALDRVRAYHTNWDTIEIWVNVQSQYQAVLLKVLEENGRGTTYDNTNYTLYKTMFSAVQSPTLSGYNCPSAVTVPTATKATQDGSGNTITSTYATQTALANTLAKNRYTYEQLLTASTTVTLPGGYDYYYLKGYFSEAGSYVVTYTLPTLSTLSSVFIINLCTPSGSYTAGKTNKAILVTNAGNTILTFTVGPVADPYYFFINDGTKITHVATMSGAPLSWSGVCNEFS